MIDAFPRCILAALPMLALSLPVAAFMAWQAWPAPPPAKRYAVVIGRDGLYRHNGQEWVRVTE